MRRACGLEEIAPPTHTKDSGLILLIKKNYKCLKIHKCRRSCIYKAYILSNCASREKGRRDEGRVKHPSHPATHPLPIQRRPLGGPLGRKDVLPSPLPPIVRCLLLHPHRAVFSLHGAPNISGVWT
jgi:hypothetical protein